MAAPAIRGVIFDCFGVLYLDTNTSILTKVPSALQREAHDIFTANNYGKFTKDEYVAQIARLTNLSPQEVELYVSREHHLNSVLTKLIEETIRPHYQVGLLSNIGRGWINDFFAKHQLHELFDEVVLSGEEGVAKPHAAIYERMADRLGLLPEECLMIDDLEVNCEGADMVGMTSIHFVTNDQLLGDLSRLGVLSSNS